MRQFPLLAILLLSLLINIIYMPAEHYGGDSLSIKLEAINWVWNGEFGIGYKDREHISSLLEVPGQFYIGDDDDKVYHNRWGPINLLYHSVPEFILSFIRPDIAAEQSVIPTISLDTVLAHNMMNIILASVFIIFIFRLLSLYSINKIAIAITIFLFIYPSFTWNYLRAQSYEILHLTLFTVFAYYFFCFLRELKDHPHRFLSIKYYFFNIPLFLLCLSKSFYLFLYPVLCLVWLGCHMKATDQQYSFSSAKNIVVASAVPGVLALIIIVLSYYFFLGLITIGFSHHVPFEGLTSFSIRHIPERLYDYFLSRNFSLWLHMPVMLLAILYYPRFVREYSSEGGFLLFVFAFLLGFFCLMYNVGEYCYGPRFFVFALPVLCIPALLSIEYLLKNVLRPLNLLLSALLLVVSAYFVLLQFEMNSRPFFSRYNLELALRSSPYESKGISSYLNTENQALIARDLNAFLIENKDIYLISEILQKIPPTERMIAREEFRQYWASKFPSNFYLSYKSF